VQAEQECGGKSSLAGCPQRLRKAAHHSGGRLSS
jgi:hypothetical protein